MRNKWDLLIELVKTSFKMRYQNSVLGFIWVLIKPYALFLVIYFVISGIRGGAVDNFGLYLLSGLIFFTYIQEMILYGQMGLLDRANVILKVNFTRQIAVLASIIGGVISYIINLTLIFGLIAVNNLRAEQTGADIISISFTGFIYMLIVSIVGFIACLGFSMFTSILTIRFRDLKNIFELAFALLYWATPIFYTLDEGLVEGPVARLISINPLTIFINEFRAGIGIYGSVDLSKMLIMTVLSVLVLILGFYYFDKQVKKVAELF